MEILEQLDIRTWQGPFPPSTAVDALETGKVLFAAQLHFELSRAEQRFLSPACLDGKSKNLSFRPATGALHGTSNTGAERAELLAMLKRYYEQ
jgi:hypothetical protein